MGWLLFVSGALATFRLSHLVARERGPFSVFERIRKALPRGRGRLRNGSAAFFVSLSPRVLSFAPCFGPVVCVSRCRNGPFIGSASVLWP